jgi:uncharacterized protein (TIGR02284 family)
MSNKEVISVLENLAETCRRGIKTFRDAADSIDNSEFRRLFNIFSQQRTQFLTEIQAEAHRLSGQSGRGSPAATATASNTVPFRPASTRQAGARDQASVIAECQREEEAAVNDYNDALQTDLPLDVQYVVKRQYMDIKDAYDRIRILQRAA